MKISPNDSPAFSHLDEAGQVRMVDVGDKTATSRIAVCRASVTMNALAFDLLQGHERGKGEVLNTARVAGVLAAKRCAELIPLCHTLPLSFVGVDFALDAQAHQIDITATCRSDGKTGVEMEAMMACSVAALTIYDMCKAVDKGIVVQQVRLLYKSGGKSGVWRAPDFTEAAPGQPGPAPAREATAATGSVAPKPEAGLAASTEAAGVSLVYFARVAEQTGVRSETLGDVAGLSGAELLARLEQRHPRIAPASRLKLAVNQEHAMHDVILKAGDEVAVFEPVTGG